MALAPATGRARRLRRRPLGGVPPEGPRPVPGVLRLRARPAGTARRRGVRAARDVPPRPEGGAASSPRPGATSRPRRWPCEPLVAAGVIERQGLIVDAASGVTGAGRKFSHDNLFATVDENFTAYGLLNHRHTPEMEQEIGAQILFTPHLVPMNRGILATCYARPSAGQSLTTAALLDVYRTRFAGRAVRRRHRGVAVDEGDARLELGARHGALRRAHRLRDRHRRPRQPGQGCLGGCRAVGQRGVGPRRDRRSVECRPDAMTLMQAEHGCRDRGRRPEGRDSRRGAPVHPALRRGRWSS